MEKRSTFFVKIEFVLFLIQVYFVSGMFQDKTKGFDWDHLENHLGFGYF